MKKVLAFLLIFISSNSLIAQNLITIQHGNSVTFETYFDSAVAHAQSGDYIYLPGGLVAGGSLISGSSTVNINKKLNIIGAGYHPDSSGTTSQSIVQFDITFQSGSAASLLTGIYCNRSIFIEDSNIKVMRCNVGSIAIGGYGILPNILISENIIRVGIGTGNVTYPSYSQYPNCIVEKNIIYGAVGCTYNGCVGFDLVTIRNNIIIAPYYGIGYTRYTIFENNIISGIIYNHSSSGTIYRNNLIVQNYSVQLDSSNIFNEPIANIFVNYSGASVWSHSENFHLKPGCQGIGLSTDSTDVGIYGTNNPFKDGGLPYNPHFQSISIPPTTSSNGTLNINITVKAQSK